MRPRILRHLLYPGEQSRQPQSLPPPLLNLLSCQINPRRQPRKSIRHQTHLGSIDPVLFVRAHLPTTGIPTDEDRRSATPRASRRPPPSAKPASAPRPCPHASAARKRKRASRPSYARSCAHTQAHPLPVPPQILLFPRPGIGGSIIKDLSPKPTTLRRLTLLTNKRAEDARSIDQLPPCRSVTLVIPKILHRSNLQPSSNQTCRYHLIPMHPRM